MLETFQSFNILTLLLTIGCLAALFLLSDKLNKLPLIAILVILGVVINIPDIFQNYQDLCKYEGTDCKFYIIKLENIVPPSISRILGLIPAAAVLTIILIFEQFLYLQEF